MKSAWQFTTCAMIGLGLATACGSSDDKTPPKGQGSSTMAQGRIVGSGSYAMHPDTIPASDLDATFPYDVTVTKDKIIIPIAGREALVNRIIPGKSVLLSRGNENDNLKNPGIMAGITAMENPGNGTAVLTYKTVSLSTIVRGHIDVAKDPPTYFFPKGSPLGVTKPQAASPKLQWDKSLHQSITMPTISLDKELSFEKGNEKSIKEFDPTPGRVSDGNFQAAVSGFARMHGRMNFEAFVDFQADIDLDIGWDFWNADIDVNKLRASLGAIYEIAGSFEAEISGTLSGSVNGDFGEWGALCTLPGPIPCSYGLKLPWDCTATVSGVARIGTDPEFKVFGSPEFGFEYSDGGFHPIQGTLFQVQAPGLSVTNPSGLQVSVTNPETNVVGIETTGGLTCHPIVLEPNFAIGPKFGIGPFDFAAQIGVGLQFYPELNARFARCWKWNVKNNALVSESYSDQGIEGRLRIDLHPFAQATLGPFGVDWTDSFELINSQIFQIGNANPACNL